MHMASSIPVEQKCNESIRQFRTAENQSILHLHKPLRTASAVIFLALDQSAVSYTITQK